MGDIIQGLLNSTALAPILSAVVSGIGAYFVARMTRKKDDRQQLSADQFKFIDELRAELREAKEELRLSRKEIAELREEITALSATNARLEIENKNLQTKVDEMRDEISHLRERRSVLRQPGQ
jgi:septal ring factor EnvC (AmiA/AmiB activator)